MKDFRIVILAAGKGTRMHQDVPKALTPVAGKPILQYLVESIEASGVDPRPVVVIADDSPKLCETFGKECDYAVQLERLGTGHAVMQAKDTVGGAKHVIVLYGDHPFVSAESLRRLAETHVAQENTVTMMTTTVPDFDGWHCAFLHWGRILRDDAGAIAGIREWKDASEAEQKIKEVNPALFCFDAAWLWENIETLRNENSQKEYYLTDLVGMCFSQGKKIDSFEIAPEEAIGINTPTECKVAEQVLLMRTKRHDR